MSNQLEIRTLDTEKPRLKRALSDFLEHHDLRLDDDVDYALAVYDGDTMAGCGCLAGNVCKCIAVDPAFQGQAVTNKIVTYLRMKAYNEGMTKLFLFTKPENRTVFESLGFTLLSDAPRAILMENSPDGIDRWLEGLKRPFASGSTASLVMNCNPFTYGHRYLIETACRENDAVHLFVVSEDLSAFPFDVRMDLIKKGTADLGNLYIHEGRDYIISRATFPSYFIKDSGAIDATHTVLDLNLFARRIAPALGISRRYVGEEPFCPVTGAYNDQMAQILPANGIELRVIKRKEEGGTAISASQVRRYVAKDRLDELKPLVPKTTYDFLISEKAEKIRKTIREKTA